MAGAAVSEASWHPHAERPADDVPSVTPRSVVNEKTPTLRSVMRIAAAMAGAAFFATCFWHHCLPPCTVLAPPHRCTYLMLSPTPSPTGGTTSAATTLWHSCSRWKRGYAQEVTSAKMHTLADSSVSPNTVVHSFSGEHDNKEERWHCGV